MKYCAKCRTLKPLSEFTVETSNPDGLKRWCRGCVKDYNSAYHKAHPDRGRDRPDYRRTRHDPIVYAVTAGPARIKVGTTVNRTHTLTGYRRFVPDAEIIWERPGGRELEAALHYELADYNVPHVSGKPSEVFQIGTLDPVLLLNHTYAYAGEAA